MSNRMTISQVKGNQDRLQLVMHSNPSIYKVEYYNIERRILKRTPVDVLTAWDIMHNTKCLVFSLYNETGVKYAVIMEPNALDMVTNKDNVWSEFAD